MKNQRRIGEKGQKLSYFCSRIFSRDEFSDLCRRLRHIESFRIPFLKGNVDENLNRLVLPTGKIPSIPEFMGSCRRLFGPERAFVIETKSHSNPIKFLRAIEVDFQSSGFVSGCKLSLTYSILVGCYKTDITFGHPLNDLGKIICSIRWFSGGLYRVDGHSDNFISERFGPDSKLRVTSSYREFRERDVFQAVPFLEKFDLRPEASHLLSICAEGNDIWKDFIEWIKFGGCNIPCEIKCNLSPPEGEINVSDISRDLSALLLRHDFITSCVRVNFDRIWFEDPSIYIAEYHEWLANMIGYETLSGCCAVFSLGNIRRDESDISVCITPDGAVIRYFQGSLKPKTPPDVIMSLCQGDEWVRGHFPLGDRYPHPKYQFFGEWEEPVLNSDIRKTVDSLSRDIRKFKAPKVSTGAEGSLEDQLDKLNKLGISLSDRFRVKDFLRVHDRTWYEAKPYINTLIFMGEKEAEERCSRVWFVDLDVPSKFPSEIRTLMILETLSKSAISPSNFSCAIDESSGSKVLAFKIGVDQYSLNITKGGDWLDRNLIYKFNDLLVTYKKNLHVYQMQTGSRSFIYSILSSSEAESLNYLLSVPFEVVSPQTISKEFI